MLPYNVESTADEALRSLLYIVYEILRYTGAEFKWFELNFGWFFVNGRKQAKYAEYLRNKYKNGNRKV